MNHHSKHFLIICMTAAVFTSLIVVFFTQFNFSKQPISVSPLTAPTEISENTAITHVRTLPEVQEFIATVEGKYKDNRRVSFRVDEANKEYYLVTVAESDEIKETTWKIFQVKKDGSEILVVNSVTGELEKYDQKNLQ